MIRKLRLGPMSRRTMIKLSLAGLAALGSPLTSCRTGSGPVTYGLGKGTMPHPNVSGLRVVGIHDPAMTRAENPVSNWREQESLVDAETVFINLDRMAFALTGEKRTTDAWKAIFLKPSGKNWDEVIVAIKTNNVSFQQTRSAVLSGICRVLVNEVGVKGGNIFIYDGRHGEGMARKSPFNGLPDDTRIAGTWGGIEAPTSVPAPWGEEWP